MLSSGSEVDNPEGVASSSPGLPSAATLGQIGQFPATLKGLRPKSRIAWPSATPSGLGKPTALYPGEPRTATLGWTTQPLQGWGSLRRFTQGSRRRQPWAGRRNPFGVGETYGALPRIAADGNRGLALRNPFRVGEAYGALPRV